MSLLNTPHQTPDNKTDHETLWQARNKPIDIAGREALLVELITTLAERQPLTGTVYSRTMQAFTRRGLPWQSHRLTATLGNKERTVAEYDERMELMRRVRLFQSFSDEELGQINDMLRERLFPSSVTPSPPQRSRPSCLRLKAWTARGSPPPARWMRPALRCRRPPASRVSSILEPQP